MEDNNLIIGQVVISKAGRDKGQQFVVLSIVSDEYVLVANGDSRTIEKPKKKKIKHLTKVDIILNDIKEKIDNNRILTNAEIRKGLENRGLRS